MPLLPITDSLAEWVLRHRADAGGQARGAQLTQALRGAIQQGVLQPTSRLPSTRALADRIGVARNTVVAAYAQLGAEGFVVAGHGSGTFVRPLVQDGVQLPAAVPAAPAAAPPPELSQRGRRYRGDPLHRFWVERPFCPGLFDATLFPQALWNRLMAEGLRHTDAAQLGRGHSGGAPQLRAAIAAHVHATRGVRCTPGQVVLTDGTAQSIALVARLLCDAGDRAWIEDPCYWAAHRALEDLGLVLQPLPLDADGAVVPPAPGGPGAKLAYLTPSHQFPTGVTMSPARRQAWLDHARAHGTVLLEDDYDSEFRYSGAPHPSLQGLDATTGAGNRVIYLGSFSKTMFPGIRLAFAIVPAVLAEVFASAATDYDRDGDQLLQLTMARFMAEGHYAAHVRRLREAFAARREILVQTLLQQVPALVAARPPMRLLGGPRGVHLALSLPAGCDDRAVAADAASRGVTVIPLSSYAVTAPQPGLLLSFAGVPAQQIVARAESLAQVLRGVVPQARTKPGRSST
ncbi:MocR-like pyridoxine biosynthesis transcription factor PdxR [Pseudaquabacterium pictum]|nr:PLP-dependent aminotransferase family protein [Rubrivivax pictus]